MCVSGAELKIETETGLKRLRAVSDRKNKTIDFKVKRKREVKVQLIVVTTSA